MARHLLARLLRRRKEQPPDREGLQRAYDQAFSLAHGPGWPWLTARLEAEMSMCLDHLLKPVTERERDYYASRVDTLLWVIDLPKAAAEAYAGALEAEADDRAPQNTTWDPSSPVGNEE